jgi:uncharacterized protein with PIN domain
MKKKESTITFKVNDDLLEVIKTLPNRSEFIRAAIMTALDSACPLCNGTGILTPKQKEHWMNFAKHHAVKRCAECDELYMECSKEGHLQEMPGNNP